MKTVFVVNQRKYPYHEKFLDLFVKNAEKYGDVQIFDMSSTQLLHEIYYKIAASECDLLISFDCAGFELRTENDTLSYNKLGCRMAHILFRNMRDYGENLKQQMNFSMFVFSVIQEDVSKIQKNFSNIPNIEWLEMPRDCQLLGKVNQEDRSWVQEWFLHITEAAELK